MLFRSDLGLAYQTHPGNQASSRGEAKISISSEIPPLPDGARTATPSTKALLLQQTDPHLMVPGLELSPHPSVWYLVSSGAPPINLSSGGP